MQTCSAEWQTHTRPARRPPQHSHHSALATSSVGARPLTNTRSPQRHPPRQVLIWGWDQKGTPGHHLLLSPAAPAAEGPDDGSTPGPALQRNPQLESRAFLQHTPSRSICICSAFGVPGKAHPTTAHHLKTQSPAPAPAPASSLWHPFLQSRIPKSFALLVCLRGFVIRDVRKDKVLPVASRMK